MARTPLLRSMRQLMRNRFRTHAQAGTLARARPAAISRRDFLRGIGTVAAAAMLPKGMAYASDAPKIAIVGGGMAGLTCALTLADRGIPATIYEASGRVGGRIFSHTRYWQEKQVSEWCGELIDTGHTTVRYLAQRFNLKMDDLLAAQPQDAEDTFYFDGAYYTKAQVDADFAAVFDAVTRDLEAAGYPTLFDAYTPAGQMLDQMTVYEWIATRVPGGHASAMGQLLDVAYTIEYGADTTDQSALNLIYFLGFQPDPNTFSVFGESDERFHIRGGNEQLPQAIAQHLDDDGLRLNCRLERIQKTCSGQYRLSFEARDDDSQEIMADIVVLAVPFSVLRDIDYERAGFDALKHTAIQELGCARNSKLQLQFDERVWNKSGAWPKKGTGSSYSDTGFQASWEVTRGQPGTAGIINFFSGGRTTASMSTARAFATASNPNVITDAQNALNQAQAVFPGLSKHWNGKATQSIPHLSPLFKASYAYYRVGQYTAFGGYEGVQQGNVFFCGDHTSIDFQGFMEGAASEGQRVGYEIATLVRETSLVRER